MAQRNARIDRFAQMSKQEEIIAKKRQEILEKQRTAQLAKAVVAAQTLAAKMKGGDEAAPEATVTSFAIVKEEEAETEEKKTVKETDNLKPANSLTAKTGKISFGIKRAQVPVPTEQPPPKVTNSFCNDGSFLENFKKILEKHEQPKLILPMTEAPTSTTESEDTATVSATEASTQMQNSDTETARQQSQIFSPAPPTAPGAPPQFAFNPNLLPQNLLLSHQQQQQPTALTNYSTQTSMTPQPPTPPAHALPPGVYFTTAAPQLVPPPPPPSTVATAMIMPMHALPAVAPPPPPPPPQMPLSLANLGPLYMIPAPEPLRLNTIPAPKEFDLSAIPKPQLNLEAIQVPTREQQQMQHMQQQQQQQIQQQIQQQQQQEQEILQQQQQQQQQQIQQQQQQQQQIQQQIQQQQQQEQELLQQQQQQQDNNDHNCIQNPATVENLIDLVAENGDEYEDKIRSHRNELHPAMWFLFDKNCEQYHKYRQQLNECRLGKQHQQQQQRQQQQQQRFREDAEEQSDQPDHKIDEQGNNQPELHKNEVDQQPPMEASKSPHAAQLSQHDADKYDPETAISGDVDSDDEYMRGMMDRNRDNIKRRIECRNELSEEERQERQAEEEEEERRRLEKKKLRKSRWGEKVEVAERDSSSSSVPTSFGMQNKPLLSAITRTDPALLQYARLNYGSTNLSEEDWKKCEEHYKVNLLYQDMMRKRQEIDRLARSGKFKYEYDSDEDVEGGTWEHKLRCAEMEATQAWASALTRQSEGKHHIGDFLPPEELKKFMEQYDAKKSNRQPDLSDYKEYKLKEDNIGFKMLQKLGWKEGQGLGTDGTGIVDPINKAPKREGNQGLGIISAAQPEDADNEYDAYRKRMMLAYRFRPNPLNNPRRAYY